MILFDVEKDNEFLQKEYKLYLSLEQLINIDKYFSQFESLSEIPSSFETLLEMKKIDIINEDKEIKIKIINPLNKKEFYISIPLNEKSLKNEIDSLIPYIKSLNDKINQMENRINVLEAKVNELYSKNERESKKKEIESSKRLFPESNIIKPEDEPIILSWFDNKSLKFHLLLDSIKDGDSLSTFYEKCEKKSPTILFFKTKNGGRFGGYTTNIWPKDGSVSNINNFVFSLNKKEKYKPIKSGFIVGREKYIQFGRYSIKIANKCSENDNNYIGYGDYEVPTNFGLNNGKQKFKISSYEVYQIEI